jgi:hypothetical protein
MMNGLGSALSERTLADVENILIQMWYIDLFGASRRARVPCQSGL